MCDCGPASVSLLVCLLMFRLMITVYCCYCSLYFNVQTCDNPCCNASTCQFADGAVCFNHEACCSNCQVRFCTNQNKFVLSLASQCNCMYACSRHVASYLVRLREGCYLQKVFYFSITVPGIFCGFLIALCGLYIIRNLLL